MHHPLPEETVRKSNKAATTAAVAAEQGPASRDSHYREAGATAKSATGWWRWQVRTRGGGEGENSHVTSRGGPRVKKSAGPSRQKGSESRKLERMLRGESEEAPE